MLTLYVKTNCPYSAAAIHGLEDLGLKYTEKNISDPVAEAELIEKGGEHKVPFLVDDATGICLYESDAIVRYAESEYGKKDSKKDGEETS